MPYYDVNVRRLAHEYGTVYQVEAESAAAAIEHVNDNFYHYDVDDWYNDETSDEEATDTELSDDQPEPPCTLEHDHEKEPAACRLVTQSKEERTADLLRARNCQ